MNATAQNLWQPYYIFPRTGSQDLDLSQNWKFTHFEDSLLNLDQLGSSSRMKMKKPTSVNWLLFENDSLPHPFKNENSKLYEFVKVWYFKKEFSKPEKLADEFVFLGSDGLDYFSKIWLNGQLLGKHEGMNGCPFIEISELLKENNELIVELKAANWEIWETFDGQKNPGRVIKPINWAGVSGAEPFFPLGIWQGIRLDIVPKIHLERPLLTFENISGDDATLSFSCELFANSHSLKKEMHYWHNQIVSRGKAKTDLSPVKESNSVEYLEGYCFNTLKLFGLLMENHFQKKIGLLYGLIKLI